MPGTHAQAPSTWQIFESARWHLFFLVVTSGSVDLRDARDSIILGFQFVYVFPPALSSRQPFSRTLLATPQQFLDPQGPNTALQGLPMVVHTLTRLADPKSFPLLSPTGSGHRHDIV
jgi:hypothetical protein